MAYMNQGLTMPADLSYHISGGGLFARFYPNTPAGEIAWRELAALTDGTGAVLATHLKQVSAQLRAAGYTVRKERSPAKSIDVDALAHELES